jgi:cell wall-associated NlpC family hydrolase
MALTRQLGALGSNQQKANQVIANIVGRQLAASRNTGWSAPAPRNDAWAAPLPRFQAPVFRQVQQQAAGAIPRMSAAQQIISQAAKQRNAQQRTNVLQQIGQRALANALTVAGNQSGAATFQPRDVAVVPRNRYAAQINAAFTPEQEGQLFDQQIQYTKAMADPYEWMDPSYSKRMDTIAGQIEQVRSGFANPAPISRRIQQEQQALAAFPQMTPQEIRGHSDSQLAALLDVSRQPAPAGSGAGTPDRPGGVDTSPNEMTRSGPPKGPPPQPGYNPLPSYDVTKGPPPQPAYNPLPSYDVTAPRSGAQQVADAMGEALPRVRGGNAGATQGGKMADDDGGGGLLGGILDAAGDVGQSFVDFLRGTPIENIVGDLRDAAFGTYEAFLNSEAGKKYAWLMEKADWARQQSVEALGEQAYGAASGKSWEEAQQGRVGSLGSVGAALNLSPDEVIWMSIFEVAPELREPVIDAYENGYTSPAHIARLEAAGVDPATAPPQFTGGRAVWEMLIGNTDNLPPVARYPIRMVADLAADPLTYLPIAGSVGKGLKGYGAAMRAAEEASLGGRALGGLLEGTGAIVEGGARAPDVPVELLVAGGKKVGSVFGEVTGLLSESARTGRITGAETAAQLDDVLQATINDAPSRGARTAFDAEAQGVTPTSGPELIDTPTVSSAVDTPTIVAREGGDVTVTPRTGTAVIDPPSGGTVTSPRTGNTYPIFDSLPEAPTSRPDAPVRIYDYNGTPVEIRPVTGNRGESLYAAFTTDGGERNRIITADSYPQLMDDLPSVLGGSHPPIQASAATPTTSGGGPTKSADEIKLDAVNQQIREQQKLLKSGNPDKMMDAAGSLKTLHRERDHLRAKIAAEKGKGAGTPPSTPVEREAAAAPGTPSRTTPHPGPSVPETPAERQAAAAANTVPGAPRNTGAAGLAQAAGATNGRTRFPRNTGNANVDKSLVRARRLAKEKRDGLPREVNKILAPQKKGEHEFSPIYGGHRPLDRIVTDAIDSRDAGKLARAEAFIKRVDDTVERELRTDAFYQTWARGGAPVYLRDDPRFTDDVFETMRLFEPDASPARLETLANGIAKGTMDDIALVQFQINQLLPMILREFPDQITSVDGLLGSIARIPGGNFRDESAAWLMREYMDTPLDGVADTILTRFLTGATERPIIADGVHMPYAHSIPSAYHAESIARLIEMRKQWTRVKARIDFSGAPAVSPVSSAPFRSANPAAQFGGAVRGSGRSLGDQMKAAAEKAKRHMATPEEVEAAIGSVRDPYLRAVLLSGNGKLTVELAEFGDRLLPSTWKPPGIREFPVAGSPKTEWNVREALEYLQEYKANHPDFDYLAARNELGASAMGLPPKLTAAQVKEMKKAARAAGLSDAEVAAIKDGATKMERLAATKAVRLFDAAMTALRSTLMFNPISGTPGRIGDVIGNSMAHLVAGKDPWGALRQIPMSFTATKKYRKLARDPGELTKAWSASTPHMAETGMVYSPSTFHGSVKLSEEDIAKLPWLNEKVKGTPVAVRTAASVWTTPYLKDITVAGELAGRKIAVDRVYLATIRRESLPAFRDYLEKRFPGQSKQLLSDIASSAQDKAGRSWGGNFSHGDVLHAVDTDAARAWQRELNRAMAKADAEAGHLFFSAKMTNADEIARRTFTFHYWMVRASWMYFRTVMQNPGMLSGFTRMYQEAQQISEEQGLPKWLSGMFKFFQGNGGMYAAMNPIGILFPLVAMDVYSQEGNKFQALQNMLSPVWSGALGGLGATQNIPNAFGTRSQERFVIDMLNFLKGEGVDLEGIPGIGQFFDNDSLTLRVPSEEFVKWVIGKANSALGQPMGAYEPFDRAANEHDQLFSIGQQIGMTLWGDDITKWTDVQVAELDAAVEQAITGVGEDTWLSETIRATYGQEGAVRAVGSLAIPGGIVTRQGFRDEQMALSQAYWDNYKDGVEPTPEQKSAAAGRQMATSAKPVWLAINTAYHAIGTPDQQRKYGIYNDVLYGPESLNPKTTIVVPNGDGTYTFFTMAELAAMEYEDRVKVVDAWAAVTDDMADAHRVVKEGRDAFKAAHPEYGQYTEYQKGVFGYEGGISQFRKEMRDNPTFKAAEDAERKQLQKEGITGSQLEAELDNWATGQEAFFAAIGEPWKWGDEVKGTPGPSSVIAMQNLRDKDEPKSGSRGGAEKPKDPNVDEFWSPEQGVPRLASDQAQWEYDNNEMERRFGAAWNADLGEWEDDYDSAKERDEAGIGDKTYVLPSTTESMRRYEAWAEEHPGGTPEEFFEQMLKTEGFGKRPKVPGTAAIQLPAGGTIYRPGTKATGPSRSAQSATSTGGRVLVTNAPNVGSRPGEDPDALRVVEVANSYVGQVPYVWGAIPGKGQDPSGGWDCSGMTYWLDQNYGSGQLPMGSHYQYAYAQDTGKLFTDLANLQPGDIVFIDTGWQGGAGGNLNPAGHVGIYAGNGKLINAANSAQGTVIVPLNSYGNILGAMHGSW